MMMMMMMATILMGEYDGCGMVDSEKMKCILVFGCRSMFHPMFLVVGKCYQMIFIEEYENVRLAMLITRNTCGYCLGFP